jgi:hypothetical protein
MKPPKYFFFVPLLIVLIFTFRSMFLDHPSSEQITEFENRLELIKVGMAKKEVKNLLGETNDRIEGEKGKPMEEISAWVYGKYGSSEGTVKPVIFFDQNTNRVRKIAYTTDVETGENWCSKAFWVMC